MFFPRKLAVVNLKRIAQITQTSSLGMGQSSMFLSFTLYIIKFLVGENMGFGEVGEGGEGGILGLHPLYETQFIEMQFGSGNLGGVEKLF